jgi:hypothetical protein
MSMPPESPIAAFDFVSGPLRGTQLTLYGARLVHHGAGHSESMALGAIAAVRVAYERDAQRIGWGATLLVLALLLFLLFRPLGDFAEHAALGITSSQAIAELLRTTLQALELLAGLLPVLGALCLLGGAALVVFGWFGATALVLMLPAGERAYAVRGQNRLLVDFAELLAERVAQARR